MNLENSVCVVTGAARGSGRAIAEALLAAGARVVLSDIEPAAPDQTVAALQSSHAYGRIVDVTSAKSVDALVLEVERTIGPTDMWINNAGLVRHRLIADYSEREIDLMLAVNLKGAILGSQAALRAMSSRRRGFVINIVSTASLRGVLTETVYCAAKWGVRGLTHGSARRRRRSAG